MFATDRFRRPLATVLGLLPSVATAVVALGLGAAVGTGAATAGAWPRDRGQSFVSLSHQSTFAGPDFGDFASLYYEYGLRNALTFGLDVGRNSAEGQLTAIAFLRYPLISGGRDVLAAEIGLGWTDRAGGGVATLRPGISWGRSYSAGWGAGWMGIESTYAIYEDGGGLAKIDGTFGINHPSGAMTILQLQYAAPSDGGATIALAPSHVFRLTGSTFVELGVSYEFRQSVSGVKIGIWQNF